MARLDFLRTVKAFHSLFVAAYLRDKVFGCLNNMQTIYHLFSGNFVPCTQN